MAKRLPTCNKCHTQHLNFLPCPPPGNMPEFQFRRPREFGPTDVGDKMADYVIVAPGVYGRARKPLHSETV